jgi:hypothetical protein
MRAHSNGNPTPARILPTAGHRPFPSDKSTVMLAGQTRSMATSIPVPSRVACWLRTANRSQRVHGDVRRLHALLVQPYLPCHSLSEHLSHQRLSWYNQEMGNYAKAFLLTVSFPSFSVTAFFLASYFAGSTHPIVILPQTPWEATFIGIVALDTFVIGFGIYMFFKPKWWYIALGSGAAITGAAIYALYNPTAGTGVFVVTAIALAISCTLVLAVSLYIIVRIWKETLKEKNRKRR